MAGIIEKAELKGLSDRIYDMNTNDALPPDLHWRLMMIASDLEGIAYQMEKTDRPTLEWQDKDPTMEGVD